MRRAAKITLTAEEWAQLRSWITQRTTPRRVRERARILLGAAVGRSNREIARTLSLDPATVAFWRRRFVTHRLEGGLEDAPKPRPRGVEGTQLADRILRATGENPPASGVRWTTRSLARHLGVSHMQVYRTWKSIGASPGSPFDGSGAGPLPRRVDLLGVVLQPPRRALVFGVSDRPQLPALSESGAETLVRPGVSGGILFTAESEDPGDLMTALQRLESWVGPEYKSPSEWHDLLILLRKLHGAASPGTRVHVLVQNCGAAEARRLSTWFRVHPRFQLHTLPSGDGWLDIARAYLASWSSGLGAPLTFGGVASFASAAARLAAETGARGHGLVWSYRLRGSEDGAPATPATPDSNPGPDRSDPGARGP